MSERMTPDTTDNLADNGIETNTTPGRTDVTDGEATTSDDNNSMSNVTVDATDAPTTSETDGWQHCHPAAMLLHTFDTLRAIGGIIVVMVLTSFFRSQQADGIFAKPLVIAAFIGAVAFIVVATVGTSILIWRRCTYRMDDTGITLRQGVIARSQRTIRYENIHAINTSTPWYARPWHLMRVTITAAGHDDANITLPVVEAPVVHALRRRKQQATHAGDATTVPGFSEPTAMHQLPSVNADLDATAATASDETMAPSEAPATNEGAALADAPPLFRASWRDIILFALTDASVLAGLLGGITLWGKASDILPENVTNGIVDSATQLIVHSGVAILAMFIALAVLALAAISLVSAIIRFYGFTVRRTDHDIIVTRGLLTERVTTTPIERIQSVTIKRSLLRRLFHLCTVEIGLGANQTDGNDSDDASTLLLPLTTDRRVYDLLQRILPEWRISQPRLRHTGRGLLRYFLTAPVATTLVATIGCVVATLLWQPWMRWATAGVLVIGAIWTANRVLCYRTEGYELRDEPDADNTTLRAIIQNASLLTVRTTVTMRSRIQYLTVSTTPWRAKRQVGGVEMHLFVIAGESSLSLHAVRDDDAQALVRWVRPR